MSYVGAFDSIKQHILRPLSLQLICIVLVMLIVWEIVSGIGVLPRLNQKVQDDTHHSHEAAIGRMGKTTIERHPLFGDYVPSNLDAAGIRQSMLNLKVVGIVFAENENDSQVILQQENGQEYFFRVGDELPGGGVIKRITIEGVLVLRAGDLERLSLPRDELNFEAPAEPMSLENQKGGF